MRCVTSRYVCILAVVNILLRAAIVHSQPIRISGVVLQATSGTGLSYASVTLKNSAVGTVTNTNGEFELFIPRMEEGDSIIVSHLGFRKSTTSVTEESYLEVRLVEESTLLHAITVVDTRLKPYEIVRKAIEKIEENYPLEPYIIKAFYRSAVIQQDSLLYVLEAALNLYDEGYRDPGQHAHKQIDELVEVEAMRTSGRKGNFGLAFLDEINMLSAMLHINNVKYRNYILDGSKHWKYRLDRVTTYQGRPVYVIRSGTSWTFELFIDVETFGIYQVAVDVRAFPGWKFRSLSENEEMRAIHFVKTIEFREREGKLVLNYINYQEEIEVRSRAMKQKIRTVTYQEDLSVNFFSRNIARTKPESVLDNTKPLDRQITSYQPAFWRNYTTIKPLPIHQTVSWIK